MTKNLFICGPNRSGTSLLREILNENDFIRLNKIESNFFHIVKGSTCINSFKKKLFGNKKLMNWIKDKDLLYQIIDNYYPDSFEIYNNLLIKTLPLDDHIEYFGEKNTFLEFRFIRYLKFYGENLNFIHIIRDPLKTYESHIYYKGKKRKINFLKWYIKWLLSLFVSKYFSIKYKNLFLSIVYSDLLENKKDIQDKINNFLKTNKIKFNERVFDFKINSSFEHGENNYKLDENLKRLFIKSTLVPIYKFLI